MIDLSLYFNDVKIRDFNTSEIDIILNYRKIFENYYCLKNMIYTIMKNYNLYKKFLRTQKNAKDDKNIKEANRLIINLLGSIYTLYQLFLKDENLLNSKVHENFEKSIKRHLRIQTLIWLRNTVIHHGLLLIHTRDTHPYHRMSLLDIELKYHMSKDYSLNYDKVIPYLKKNAILNDDFSSEINIYIKKGIFSLKKFLNKYSPFVYDRMYNAYKRYCKLLSTLNKEVNTKQFSNIKKLNSNNILKCKSKTIKIAPFILEKYSVKEHVIDKLSKKKNDFIKQLFLEYKNI